MITGLVEDDHDCPEDKMEVVYEWTLEADGEADSGNYCTKQESKMLKYMFPKKSNYTGLLANTISMDETTGELKVDESSFKSLRHGRVQLKCNEAGDGTKDSWEEKAPKFYTQLIGPSADATCAASAYDGLKASNITANPWAYLEEPEPSGEAAKDESSSFASSKFLGVNTFAFMLLSLIATVFASM